MMNINKLELMFMQTCHNCASFIPEKEKITVRFSKNMNRSSTKLKNIECCRFAIPKIWNIPEKGYVCSCNNKAGAVQPAVGRMIVKISKNSSTYTLSTPFQ